jgi:hypothetical protein
MKLTSPEEFFNNCIADRTSFKLLSQERSENIFPNLDYYKKLEGNNPQSMHYKYKYPEDENRETWDKWMGDN